MPDQPLFELLDEMLASAEKATPGPWRNHLHRGEVRNQFDRKIIICLGNGDPPYEAFANGDFVSASRTTLPAALAALKVAVERLHDARDRVDDLSADEIDAALSTISQLIRSARE